MVVTAMLVACAEPPPPRSVDEFIHNPIVLEAVLVRCAQNRAEMRYEAECVNAREASEQIAAREEATRREAFEKQSERKRQALRRAQEAAATARRRAEEERRRQEEQDYLAQFGHLPPEVETPAEDVAGVNEPVMVIAEPGETPTGDNDYDEQAQAPNAEALPASEPGAARADPASQASGAESEPLGDLDAVREELRRRNEGDQ